MEIRGDIGAALCAAASESLENLAFMELTPGDPAPPEAGWTAAPVQGFSCARIGLGRSGRLELALAHSLLEELSCVLYNLEPDRVDEAARRDTLLEIANIVAGRFLSILSPQAFDLGLPVLRPAGADWAGVEVGRKLASPEGGELILGYAREG